MYRVSALERQIGNTIERESGWSLVSDQGLALAANGTILAVSSSYYKASDPSNQGTYQVDVYQLVEEGKREEIFCDVHFHF